MEVCSNNNVKKIALLGAGLSNLTFNYSLKTTDKVSINIFERSKVISGRAATRSRDGYYYDNGANYFNITDSKISQIILRELNTENLIEIKKWIYPFDKDFNINYDETLAVNHNQKTKYNYLYGIRTLGDLLYNASKIKSTIKFSKNITKIIQLENNSWRLFSEEENLGDFDYIVFGMPSPNIARIFINSDFNNSDTEFFKKSIDQLLNNSYKKIYSLAIAYSKYDIGEEFNKFFALINSDRKNPISWVCIENEKNRSYIDNQDNVLLIIQMSDEFSTANQNIEKDIVLKLISDNLVKLLPSLENKQNKFYDLKLWGHALPNLKLNESLIKQLEEKNIFVIGDSLNGRGRVDEAMLTGLNLYERLGSKF